MLPSVGTLLQVTLVCVVVAGQLPQFNALMLYWRPGQSRSGIFRVPQLNVIIVLFESQLAATLVL